ncbi:MAG: hypothetical protein Q9172_003801 [Xanthocarpia lactea]
MAEMAAKRVQCAVVGCGKMFNRKEHLTRHLKSHDPQRQYTCHVCGRRYARSDVLKRHVEQHADEFDPTRTLVACLSCHQRKLKCDDGTPCRSCLRDMIECSRANVEHESTGAGEPDFDHGRETSALMETDFAEMSEMESAMPSHHRQQSWLRDVQDPWSLQYPATDLGPTFPPDLNTASLQQWPMSNGLEAQAFTALPEHSKFPTLVMNGPAVESSPSEPQRGVDLNGKTLTHLASHSPAFSGASQSDHVGNLHDYLNREPMVTERLIQVYFAELQPRWPILHAPTFEAGNAPIVMIGAMAMLVTWLEGNAAHVELSSYVFADINKILLESYPASGKDNQLASLSTLQTLLLCVVYATSCSTRDGVLARAVHFNGSLVSLCRLRGVFGGQYSCVGTGDSPSVSWVAQEQVHRLAYAVLRADAYLSVLTDHPPSVRYHEIGIPLPKCSHIWAAATEDERRSLQWDEPAGRGKALFCFLVHDFLDPSQRRHLHYRLTEADYHLTLCSSQIGIWDAVREAHNCEGKELYSNSLMQDSVAVWSNYLDVWRTRTEKDCLLRQAYFSRPLSDSDLNFAPISLILWHLSALNLHAPVRLLQGQGCCAECRSGTPTVTHKNRAHVRAWVASANARIAVWNAAQICRIVARESTGSTSAGRLLLNPPAMPALLKSAVVICAYAYHTRACPLCTGGPPIDLVDIFGAKDDNNRLIRWKETGEGLADWVPLSIPVCKCKVGMLAKSLRQALARDRSADVEFVSFISGLEKR